MAKTTKWSDGKKWIMGILAVLLTTIFGTIFLPVFKDRLHGIVWKLPPVEQVELVFLVENQVFILFQLTSMPTLGKPSLVQ